MVTVLRDYQSRTVDAVRNSIRSGHHRPLLVAPTGSGKTAMAVSIVASAVGRGRKVLFLAPRRELIFQTADKLQRNGIAFGVRMAGETQRSYESVQVACVPTLVRRCITGNAKLPHADVVIVDEAHLSIAKQTHALLQRYDNAITIGLTATPARSDGCALGTVYDDLVLGPTVDELTKLGFLVPVRYFAPTQPDLEKIKVVRGDYDQHELGNRMDNTKLVGDVIDNWQRIAQERPTVVFCVNIAHSIHVCKRFQQSGIAAEQLDGGTDNGERAAILRRLASGETRVVVNCDVLTYGWDSPTVSCAVLAKPTKSLTRYMQMVGRVLRTSPGKTDTIVIDHSGNVDRLGFVDEPVEWTLDGKTNVNESKAQKKAAGEMQTLTCPRCGYVFLPAAACPNCGADMHHVRRGKAMQIEQANLVELGRDKRALNRNTKPDAKRQFFGELLAIAAEHGYRRGFAAHQYRRRFGVWPNAYGDATPQPPTKLTREFVRAGMNAWRAAR